MPRRLIATLFMALVALSASCGEDKPSADPTGTVDTPAASATATLPPAAGEVRLTIGEPVPFPEDLALIIATGCWQCDGPTTSITRLRQTDAGIEERVLFDAIPPGGNITGMAFDVATGRAAVSTCAPNCSGLGEFTGTEQTVIHLSTDDGASFTASQPVDGWFTLAGYAGVDLLMSGPFDGDDAPNPVRSYPDALAVPAPPGGEQAFATPAGVLWTNRERTRLLAPGGTVLFTSAGDSISEVTPLDVGGERIAVLLFRQEEAEAGGSGYRLFIGRGPGDKLEHERTLSAGFIHAGAALDDCTIVANTDLPQGSIPTPETGGAFFSGFLPALIDVCEGEIQPIVDPFTRAPYLNGRNVIAAVQAGPFLSVPDNIGDCLNVRESPSTDAPSLGCFAAGVLFGDLEESQDVAGTAWRKVRTPAGDEGWASADFLTP
jgi:hypothetical protein